MRIHQIILPLLCFLVIGSWWFLQTGVSTQKETAQTQQTNQEPATLPVPIEKGLHGETPTVPGISPPKAASLESRQEAPVETEISGTDFKDSESSTTTAPETLSVTKPLVAQMAPLSKPLGFQPSTYLLNLLANEFHTTDNRKILTTLTVDKTVGFTKIVRYLELVRTCYRRQESACSSHRSPQDDYFNEGWDVLYLMGFVTMLVEGVEEFDRHLLAQTLSQTDNDWVRESSIKLAATLSPSFAHLETLMEATRGSINPRIYELFIDTVKQSYNTPPYIETVTEFLVESIQQGGFYVGKTLPTHILPLVSAETIDQYEDLLVELHPNSYRFRALQKMIQQYNSQ